jgi:serine/threonine-protein kinase
MTDPILSQATILAPGMGAGSEVAIAPTLGRGVAVGRYLVLSRIGRGAMGEVCAAYDPELDRRVALKLLHTARGSDAAKKRLLREARALGKLSHPNVVQVHDVGEHEGNVFVAMELVDGQSLDAWQEQDPRPQWREVLAAYLDAARGLGAAHREGIVHRDVKPANILRGKDGRVRVVDFGIARSPEVEPGEDAAPAATPAAMADLPEALSETLPARTRPGSSDRLTLAGSIMGTPLYMSPEQHTGSAVGPASDQYSLCVALYEALYRRVPFTMTEGASIVALLDELLAQKRRGAPNAPPSGAGLPAWVHRAIARGLAAAPEDRYPSMTALIAALSDDPEARRRKHWAAAGGLVVFGILSTLAGLRLASGAARDPCAHRERQLAGVWDGDVEQRMRAAFLATGRPHAEGTATRVAALLDRYSQEWTAMRGEVCQASRGAGQLRETLALRDACLDRRRDQLRALAAVFAARPDPEVLDRAVQGAAGLAPIGYCADTEALRARVRPPEDAALRARVEELTPRADRLEALFMAGKFRDGLALGEPLLAETASVPYAPLRAHVQHWVGRLRSAVGDYDAANALLRDAAISAAEGKDDVLSAYAWARLLFVVGNFQRRFAEATVIRALGPTAIVRAHDDRAEATWLNSEGLVLYRMGRYAEALAAHERALALREKALGPDHFEVAQSLNNIGLALEDAGELRRAQAAHERALALWEKTLGPDHPDVALSLSNLGVVLSEVGEYARALALVDRALAIKERSLGSDHPEFARSLFNKGFVLRNQGDYAGAVSVLERAIATWERSSTSGAEVAEAWSTLGRAHVHLGHLEDGGRELERAYAMHVKAEGEKSINAIDPLVGLAELSLTRGEPDAAVAKLERALALDVVHDPELRLTLAEALWQLKKDRARARSLAEEAKARYKRIGHQPGQSRAEAWLAQHAQEVP